MQSVVHVITQSVWMQEEFLLKTGGVHVDWLFKNIVMDHKEGPSTLLEVLRPPNEQDKLKSK